jgi:hypothetical protein
LADKVYSEGVSYPNTYGHWGRNYPKNLKDAVFLGLSRDDLISLAILQPGKILICGLSRNSFLFDSAMASCPFVYAFPH